MSWLRRLIGRQGPDPAEGAASRPLMPSAHAGTATDLAAEPMLRCLTCGKPLGFDAEDEPTGDAGGPICGECNRARNFDVLFGI